jgi:radical SAM protein with 4Fe4S-binding SPASM domain
VKLLPLLTDTSPGACKSGCAAGPASPDIEARVRALEAEMRTRVDKVAKHPGTILPELPAHRPAPADIRLASDAPLPLASEIGYRNVDGAHLWIAVQEGAVLVLDDTDNERFRKLMAGSGPRELVSCELGRPATSADVAERLGSLLGRIAGAGFLSAGSGYHGARLPTPHRFARLHLTKACQLQCVHCYADSSPRADRTGERPTDWWRSVLERLASVGGERVLFTGGEALVHRGCLELMRCAKDLGMHVTLFTNGILVPKALDAIVATCDQVQVSLDGPIPEINDPIRGKGSYGKAVRALEALLPTKVHVRVGITTMADNWDAWREHFLNFADRFAGTGLEYRMSFGVTEHGRADGLGQQLDPKISQPEVQRLMAAVGSGEESRRVTRKTSGCGYFEQIVIGPDGTVYPCHLLDAPLGHLDDHSIEEWVRRFTELASLFSVDHTEGCSACDIRYLCGGTCRVMNGKRTGSRLITNCTDADKLRRFRNLVRTYINQPAAATVAESDGRN